MVAKLKYTAAKSYLFYCLLLLTAVFFEVTLSQQAVNVLTADSVTLPEVHLVRIIIFESSARLTLTVRPNGSATTCWIEWGAATPNEVSGDSVFVGEQNEEQQIFLYFKDLLPQTTYRYRILASNDSGVQQDTERVFTTLAEGDSRFSEAETLEADSLTSTSVRLRASVRLFDLPTWLRFIWGVRTEQGGRVWGRETPFVYVGQYLGSDSVDVEMSAALTGFVPGVTYSYYSQELVATSPYNADYVGTNEHRFTTLSDSTSTGISIPILVTSSLVGAQRLVYLGVHSYATPCLDFLLGEIELPPPGPGFDVRFVGACLAFGSKIDYHNFVSPEQVDTFRLKISAEWDQYPIHVRWPKLDSVYAGSVTLTTIDEAIDMKTQTSYTITSPDVQNIRIIAHGPKTSSHFPDIIYSQFENTPMQTLLSALVTPNGLPTHAWFEWGESALYGNSTALQNLGDGLVPVEVIDSLAGLASGATYHYRLVAQNSNDTIYTPDYSFIAPDGVTDVLSSPEIAHAFTLTQNYPNPFNPDTKIEYFLPKESKVKLAIYNVLGEEVKTVLNEHQSAGFKSIRIDASNFPSGVYFYRLTAGSYTDVKKMLLAK